MNRLLPRLALRPASLPRPRAATPQPSSAAATPSQQLQSTNLTRAITSSTYRHAEITNARITATTTSPPRPPIHAIPPQRAPATAIQALGRTRPGGPRITIRAYPRNTPQDERVYCKQHLAAAFRVFAARGYDEGVAGHISVRDPILTDHFWLNPLATHFSLIRTSDLVLVDEAGHVVEGHEPVNTAAFTIHSAIHRARPDVHAACHAHSVHGKAFSCFGRELEMITQDALRFYKSHSVYPHFGGVVVDQAEGERIGAVLGEGKAVILQNHGLLTVGASVDEAAFWFMSLDRSCHAQLLADAAAAGSGFEKRVIEEAECEYSSKSVGSSEKGWLAFQPYYDEILAKTGGDFLQ